MSLEKSKEIVLDYIMGLVPDSSKTYLNKKNTGRKYLNDLFEAERKNVYVHDYAKDSSNLLLKKKIEYRADFAKKVKFCQSLHNNINIAKLQDTLIQLRNENAQLTNNDSKIIQMHSQSSQNKSILLQPKKWMVVASVVILIFISAIFTNHILNRDSLENRLYEKYYTPCNYSDGYLANGNTFNIAKQKYLDGDYFSALVLLKDQPPVLTIEKERDFLIALSFMETSNYKVSILYLEKLLAGQTEFEYIPQVKWYLGLCYLKTGEKKRALNLFKSISKNNGYQYKKAKKIVKKLES